MNGNLNVNTNEMQNMANSFDESANSQHDIIEKASRLSAELTSGSYTGTGSSALKAEFDDAYQDVLNYLAQADRLGDATRKISKGYAETDEELANRAKNIGF